MEHNLLKQLDELKQYIEVNDISGETLLTREWEGADVLIKKNLELVAKQWIENQPIVISFQSKEPRRRVVVTNYSKELSWLFYRLGDIFSAQLDYVSKYDFYGLLAQSAIDYLANNDEDRDAKTLLITVLNSAKEFSKDEPAR